MDLKGLGVTLNAFLSLSKYTKHLLLHTDTLTDRQTAAGQIDVQVEIVI